MNRLAFSTVIPAGSRGNDRLSLIADAGFDGVEPTFVPQDTWPCVEDPRPSAVKLRKAADRLGLAVPSMRGGPEFWPNFASPDRACRDRAVALADSALEAVDLMGGDTLLIVPGRWEPTQSYEQHWNNALETAKRIAEVAEKHCMTVALENVENRFLMSPNEWALFLDQVGSPRVRMYFDVGNVLRNCQGHPHQWLLQLRKYIRRVHFKDAREGERIVGLFEGQVDWAAVRSALRAVEYQDWIGVELDIPDQDPAAMLKNSFNSARKVLTMA